MANKSISVHACSRHLARQCAFAGCPWCLEDEIDRLTGELDNERCDAAYWLEKYNDSQRRSAEFSALAKEGKI